LYVVDVGDDHLEADTGQDEHGDLPDRCRVAAWRPPISGISEVFHARIVNYGYPAHVHDTWTVLIVDTGAIHYELDQRRCGAFGQTVAILPPGVTHNGQPAAGASGFTKRVLYLDQDVLPIDLVGAAVDQTNIDDPALRSGLVTLHEQLVGGDSFHAESCLALVTDRIGDHLSRRSPHPQGTEPSVARRLREMLDEADAHPVTLTEAAERLGRTKAHLVRSFTAAYGIAPHAYLISRRVDAARKLLLGGVRPADAAVAAGFYDQSHLARHFKRHTSVSPGAFRTDS
jgi:AraC-like DNA-binding protein